jgi:hypothetical protein
MNGKISEKTREYSFRTSFPKTVADRFEIFVRDRGLKKTSIVYKAILEYLDRHEKDQE